MLGPLGSITKCKKITPVTTNTSLQKTPQFTVEFSDFDTVQCRTSTEGLIKIYEPQSTTTSLILKDKNHLPKAQANHLYCKTRFERI